MQFIKIPSIWYSFADFFFVCLIYDTEKKLRLTYTHTQSHTHTLLNANIHTLTHSQMHTNELNCYEVNVSIEMQKYMKTYKMQMIIIPENVRSAQTCRHRHRHKR